VPLPLDNRVQTLPVARPTCPCSTLRNKVHGRDRADHDPGRGLVTGKWNDHCAFKGPDALRGLRAVRRTFITAWRRIGEAVEFYQHALRARPEPAGVRRTLSRSWGALADGGNALAHPEEMERISTPAGWSAGRCCGACGGAWQHLPHKECPVEKVSVGPVGREGGAATQKTPTRGRRFRVMHRA